LPNKIHNQIAKGEPNDFSENEIIDVFFQMCKGVKYLHERNLIHRELKPENIFITEDSTIKIADFAIAKYLDEAIKNNMHSRGFNPYLPPEFYQKGKYDIKGDIWSLGVILYELCTLKKPFRNEFWFDLLKEIVESNPPSISENYSKQLGALVELLLSKEPTKRPTIQQILKNNLFNFIYRHE
jgi:NIMA (never in mitosis gene a)-related kinase